ncbi:TlpA disulfide reductase family protein [Frateuria sp. STR12]|uniref:TlpA family protein disulfide reductase n=1 Tax=Frateuria hangzhouensis TaxID=2995589 RepID=UPI002B1FF405|nr:TlpA disulfide reductase family protein [Frateuria sp. STR12]
MRQFVLLLGLYLLAMPLWADSGQQRAEAAGRGLVGTPAPPLVLTTIDGKTIDLGQLYGKKAVYLKFWATWCVPCREQMPHFEKTYEQAGPELAVIAIDVGFEDSVAQVRKYRREVGLKMPIVFDHDGRLGEAFRLRVTPQHVVIGRDGRIAYVGHQTNAALEAALAAARRAPVAPAGVVATAPASGGAGVDRLPALAISTLDGQVFRTGAPAPAQPTVLVFLSPWCESYLADSRPEYAEACRRMREQVTALAATPGVHWLGIASGLWTDRDDLEGWRRKHRIPVPLALDADGALFRRFGVMHVPTVLLADGQGRIVRRLEGRADLAAALRSLPGAGTRR